MAATAQRGRGGRRPHRGPADDAVGAPDAGRRANAELRWSDDYTQRLAHLLAARVAVALPGGIGTLAEATAVWAAAQTEPGTARLVLVGAGLARPGGRVRRRARGGRARPGAARGRRLGRGRRARLSGTCSTPRPRSWAPAANARPSPAARPSAARLRSVVKKPAGADICTANLTSARRIRRARRGG